MKGAENSLIVTGVALNIDVFREKCAPCEYDFSWIFEYPSTLLWADKIIVSPSVMEIIEREVWPNGEYSCLAKVISIYFGLASSHGLIEIRDPEKYIAPNIEAVRCQADLDLNHLVDNYPELVQLDDKSEVPGGFKLNGYHYCSPRVEALYYSLILARVWNARILLNDYSDNYLKYRLGLRTGDKHVATGTLKAFSTIFSEHVPEINIGPAIGKRTCWDCKSLEECDRSQLRQIERGISKLLLWREYDEINQMKEVFRRICQTVARESKEVKPGIIALEFEKEKRVIARKIRKVFPNVDRWSYLATLLSIPVVIAGITSNSPLIRDLGAGLAGIATVTEKYLAILRSKYQWVGFRQGKAP
jgi:hypothetical protein